MTINFKKRRDSQRPWPVGKVAWWLRVLAILAALLPVSPVSAQATLTQPNQALPTVAYQQGPTDPQELEAFLDDFLAERMEATHVPGLVFVMVKDGKVFLAKGYGYANIANKIPMTSQSILRVGSISKVVTAAAIMQLVERGLINLDAPINQYLPHLDLADRYAEPSTVAQLLTHTAGYDDTILRTHAPTQDEWLPLADFLAAELPPRAMPPGQVLSYSSWDYALLGLIIEEVTGTPYEQFIAENIFQPLGMTDSTFIQPLPSHIADKLAIGYQYVDGTYKPVPHDFVKLSPGVALVSTGDDMATYMLAVLGGGQYGDARILNPETVQAMLQRQATHHPLLRGNTYGPVEIFPNNQRALQQDGNGIGFTSRLVLVPEHSLGFFISLNSPVFSGPGVPSPQNRLLRQLSDALFDRYFPAPAESAESLTPPTPLPEAKDRAGRFVGYYRPAYYSRHTFFKLEVLLDQIPVSDNGDGTLQIGSGRYMEIEPLLFQLADGREIYAAFRENAGGDITYLLFGGTGSYEKVPWYESQPFHQGLAAVLVLLSLSAVVGWPLAYLIRRRSVGPVTSRLGRWAAGLVSLLNLVFLVGFGMSLFQTDFTIFFKTVPSVIRALLVIPVLSSLLTLSLPVFTVIAWKDKEGPLVGRVHYTLVTLAALAFVPFLMYWNLLGLRF